MKNGIYHRNVKPSFKPVISALLIILLLAASRRMVIEDAATSPRNEHRL